MKYNVCKKGVAGSLPSCNQYKIKDGHVVLETSTKEFIIDESDLYIVQCCRWRIENGYVYNKTHGLLHRKLLGMPKKTSGDKRVIDHINGNPLDNRRENLRVVTQRENTINGKARGGSSQHRGVALDKRSGKWEAYIWHDYKKTFLGYFNTEEEAISARVQEENTRGVFIHERA